ncbi:MAG: acyltransferase [bacterium]|nr:acyltransferase [bacterium]MDZ4228539.1 acyltransferase [Candidatus Levybacteria bacterium]
MIYSESIHFSKNGISFTDKDGNKLMTNEAFRRAFVRFYNWSADFQLLVLRWVGFVPCHFTRKFFYNLAGIKIGKGSTIHMGCNFFEPSGISIGEGTIVGNGAFLDGRAPLVIGNHVDIASEVMIYNSEHDVHSEDWRAVELPVMIDDYAFVGPRAIILPGVKIGKGGVVAAGAVVTHDVEPGKIVAGIPAKEIGERKIKDYHYRLGRARLFQ